MLAALFAASVALVVFVCASLAIVAADCASLAAKSAFALAADAESKAALAALEAAFTTSIADISAVNESAAVFALESCVVAIVANELAADAAVDPAEAAELA